MTIDNWLRTAQARLQAATIDTARLDSLILLEDQLQLDRSYLLAHPEADINEDHIAALELQLTRRTQHEPLAYIRGYSEFYGRKFYVNAHVLEPRPESESIIELLKQLAPPQPRIADIGTGSGALAITAKIEIPEAVVAAVDIDEACLTVAKRNAVLHTTQIAFYKGDLLAPLSNFAPTVLLANLPYVPDAYQINTAATHEPALALFGGADGLDLYRTLFKQIDALALAAKPSLILAESLPDQHPALQELALQSGYKLHTTDDFIQAFIL